MNFVGCHNGYSDLELGNFDARWDRHMVTCKLLLLLIKCTHCAVLRGYKVVDILRYHVRTPLYL